MMLKSGSRGEPVNVMERQLNAAGYACPVTGVYDAAITAVCKFQADHGLVIDGLYGPITEGTLLDVLRAKWLAFTNTQVGPTNLPNVDLSDGSTFSANFSTLAPGARLQFWSQLILAIMSFESSYDPGNVYREKDGTLSIGLMQLSYSDQAVYGNQGLNQASNDLMDPLKNIAFAVTIMNRLAGQDPCLSKCVNGTWKGISAYWGTMRTDSPEHQASYNGIVAKMNSLTFT